MLHLIPSDLTRTARGVLAAAALAAVVLPQAQAAAVSGQGTWATTLQGRDLDGNAGTFEAYYDTALNITWLADANFAQTSGYDADGFMFWSSAKTWADNLVVGSYSDWRLPTMVDTGTSGCNESYAGGTDCGFNVQTKDGSTGVVYSEMAHLYYVTLGNKGSAAPGTGAFTQEGWGLSNTGPFSNVQSNAYWTGLEYAPYADYGWLFDTYNGYQGNQGKPYFQFSAWAVRAGDVVSVPEPQTYALMGLGVAAVMVVARRRRVE
jgi:PEP-CTERM motif